MTPATLDDFIAVEAPSGALDGQYAQLAATLRQPLYPQSVNQLAQRIIADGVEHFSRFRELKLVLQHYNPSDGALPPYLLDLQPAGAAHPAAVAALAAYGQIIANLSAAYAQGDLEDARHITQARAQMDELARQARLLAADGFGIPFFTAELPAEPPAARPRFSAIRALLDTAVNQETIGQHGNFWHLSRDEFIAFGFAGQPLMARRADGTFDADESNLVKALESRAPFGLDSGVPGASFRRMPAGFAPLPAEQIAVIRQWIKDGCPDD